LQSRGLFVSAVPTLAWKDRENRENTSIRSTVGNVAKIRTGYL